MELYPPKIVRALELAAQWHEGQWRRHPEERIPYIAHPAGVGFILARAGFDEEVVSAGILHDVIEDCGVTPEQLAAAMGDRVTSLVQAVSQPTGMGWQEGKDAYVQQLRTSPVEALAISCADHLYNLNSLLQASAASSSDVWLLFHGNREQRFAHEHLVLSVIAERLDHPLVGELKDTLARAEAAL